MFTLSNIYKEFGEKVIFDNVNLQIYDGEKVGIIGNNGQGKSTLLNIIAGIDKDFQGKVIVDGEIAYLKQSSFMTFDELESVFKDELQSGELMKNLSSLKFNGSLDNVDKLSCGEKTKLAFAMAYAKFPQVLLLDEPTNHLDLTGRKVLAEIIKDFYGIVLVVSHDIDFLNETVGKIVKIHDGALEEYAGNYDFYMEEYRKQQLNIKREYEKHTKQVKEIEENIMKIKQFAEKSERDVGRQDKGSGASYMQTKTKAMVHAKKMNKQVASRISRLEKQLSDAPEKPFEERQIKYKFDVNPLNAKIAVKFSDVSFGYGEKNLYIDLNFEIKSGEKVGIIGDNGIGKTTLMNLITKKLTPQNGTIFTPSSLNTVIMEQDIYDLDNNATIDELSKNGDAEYRRIFLTNLINMNIDKSRFNTKIKFLSLGERMRIKLNFVILSDANFVMLDEPTNHLDIENKEFMQKVLADFKGTLLVISHDLNFIQGVCDKVYRVENENIVEVNVENLN